MHMLGKRPAFPESFGKLDYLPQPITRFPIERAGLYKWNAEPLHDYDAFFFKVGEICRLRALNCIYEHGLLLKSVAEQNREFVENLGDLIQRAGLTVMRHSPVEISDDDLANTINHVRPEVRSIYTKKLYDLFASSLR